MPVVVSIDLGTTKITSLALEADSGNVLAVGTIANDANVTSDADRTRGRSEWNARHIASQGLNCLKRTSQQLGPRTGDVVGIGITGQQHGMLLIDSNRKPISPLINWQDRRALDAIPGRESTWLQAARDSIGEDSWRRTGCRLHPGFMAVTLFWLKAHGRLPADSQACFVMDYFGSVLTSQPPITEPSCAGSSGVFNVRTRQWDDESIRALDLPRSLFPEVREANERCGLLTREAASATGLPEGTPVFPPIGDHQASFLGSVADRRESVLVNVGTGAQVAVYTDRGVACQPTRLSPLPAPNDQAENSTHTFTPPIELRPFPCGGNLLSNVGLAGGWSYQVLEQFFRDIGRSAFNIESPAPLYEVMNRLASDVPPGADGLHCEPLFSGTRLDPAVRGSLTGLSPHNFSARHLARAVLEGMARSLHDGYAAIQQITGRPQTKLIAAGNGLRENPLLAHIVSQSFGLPITFTEHREEAAYGAALIAAVGCGVRASLDETFDRS